MSKNESDIQEQQQDLEEDQIHENLSRKKRKVFSSSKKKADKGPDVLPGTEALVVTDRFFCCYR
jgi:hypothetical protein